MKVHLPMSALTSGSSDSSEPLRRDEVVPEKPSSFKGLVNAETSEATPITPRLSMPFAMKMVSKLKVRAERAKRTVEVRRTEFHITRVASGASGGTVLSNLASAMDMNSSFTSTKKAGPQVYEKMGGYGASGVGDFKKGVSMKSMVEPGGRSMAQTLWAAAKIGAVNKVRQQHQLNRQSTLKNAMAGDGGGFEEQSRFQGSGIFNAGGGGQPGSGINFNASMNMSMLSRRGGQNTRSRKAPAFTGYEMQVHIPVVIESWMKMQSMKSTERIGSSFCTQMFSRSPLLQSVFGDVSKKRQSQLMVNIIESMVGALYSPDALHQKLKILAPMHKKVGVTADMMPVMAESFLAVIQEVLGDEVSPDIMTSWTFLWDWMRKSMVIVLEDASHDATVLTQSWDLANDNVSEEAMGGLMFDTLFAMAPNLRSEFPKPKQMMAVKFAEMLSTLASFEGDDARMKEQIFWIALRHLKYGVKALHAPAMGQIILATIQSAVGEEVWNDDLSKAWQELWDTASSEMIEMLQDAEKHGDVVKALWAQTSPKISTDTLGRLICKRLMATDQELLTRFYKTHLKLPDRVPPKAVKRSEKDYKTRQSQREAEKEEEEEEEELDDLLHDLEEKLPSKSVVSRLKSKSSALVRTMSDMVTEKDARNRLGASMKRRLKSVGSTFASLPKRTYSQVKFSRRWKESNAEDDEDNYVDDNGEVIVRPPGKAPNEAQAVGMEIREMITSILDLLWEPDLERENFTCIASRLHELGILASHLESIGEGIMEGLQRFAAEWDESSASAWKWLWSNVSKLISSGMRAMEMKLEETIKRSWSLIKESNQVEEIGEEIFAQLVKTAPHVLHLFNRPKLIQAAQFVSAVEMIILFSQDPTQFFHDIKGLTVRHIKYGVKAEYVKPFGKAILTAIKELLGDEFKYEEKMAWEHLWLKVSCSVASSLSVGTSLVNVALVQGDLEKLIDAIECAPRGQRSQWLTEVAVHGTIVSPLYWAIRDGKFSMGKYILDDLLAIRADRDAYYYGRETLWATHHDVMHVLCHECPMLLEDVFDGLMWHAHTVMDGTIRVNYYVQELYGDPQLISDPWKTPLAILTLEGEPQMFMHPAVAKVLDLKWNRYGQKGFLAMQLFWTVMLILYTLGFVVYRNDCSTESIALRFFVGGLSIIIICFYISFIVRQFRSNQVIHLKILGRKYPCPRFYVNPWNVTRLFTNAIMIVVSMSEPCLLGMGDPVVAQAPQNVTTATGDMRRGAPGCPVRGGYVQLPHVNVTWTMVLNAITTFSMCIQFVQLLTISDKLAAFTYTIGRMFEDVYRNLLVISIISISFSATLTVLREDNFETLDISIIGMLRTIIGLHSPSTTYVSPVGMFVYVLFIVIIDVGFLNILIAQLALAYESLTKETAGFSRMNRAYTTVEIESIMSVKRRTKYFDELGFENPLEFDNGDAGPPGGLQVLEPASVRADPRYIPDRIMRYTGEANENDPWPRLDGAEEESQVIVEEREVITHEEVS